ncbi:MAG: ATP-binding protein [Deltaproteobacteria bacterium]|nr:ATP-binding protein [Deltaproteobacteria bacterium]
MLLKKELDELMKFMKNEGKALGLSKQNTDSIFLETEAKLSFTFPSHTSQLELIRLISTKVAAYVPAFSEENLDDIGLAMDEACTNVISHSYLNDPKGMIKVEYTLGLDKIRIQIIDEGEKGQLFNPDDLSPVDKEAYLQNLSRGGLGVHLIKKIMDEVEYTVSPGVHNCLKMVKYAG